MTPRRNLEVKARCADLNRARQRLTILPTTFDSLQLQTDTYFRTPHGRLKVREIAGQPAVLIAYERPDAAAVRTSTYHLIPAPEPATLKAGLTATLGIRGIVRKRREVHLWHNVRIHLDEVADLGTFVEFEAVQGADADEATSQQYLEQLRSLLELTLADYLAVSYADLLGLE